MEKFILKIKDKSVRGGRISHKEAERLYSMPLIDLRWAANRIRETFKEDRIELCSIVNAKSGVCAEDCKFCAQSGYYKTNIERYPLIKSERIFQAAVSAKKNGATCFGIVTSGKGVTDTKEIAAISKALKDIKKNIKSLKCSVSLGIVEKGFLSELRKAGLDRFHHNLETSKNYFSEICTTHTYRERLSVIEDAKKIGLRICSGGIFGLGEKRRDRLELAFTLRDMDVDSVPLNFLHPIKGTPLENARPMPVDEILRTIAIFRIVLPKKDIKVCGGRLANLRSLQYMIFLAGASGMMIGNYLTQPGQDPAADLRMIEDLGLRAA
jgi:biotin synthase